MKACLQLQPGFCSREKLLIYSKNVYNTLAHRAKVISSNQEALDQDLLHIRRALLACQFPNWALNQVQHKFHRNNQPSQQNNNTSILTNNKNKRNITIVISYIQGTGEKVKKVCKAKDIQVHFKGTNTPRTLLVIPKDKDPKLNKHRVIYHFKYPQINYPEAYIGESGRTLGDRIKEHLKASSAIHHHSSSTGHPLSPQCFNIIHQKTQGPSRNIKETMFILENGPSLNRNLGKYQLPHMWDNILQDTPALEVRQSNLSPTPSPLLALPLPKVPKPSPTPHHQSRVGGTCTLFGKYPNGVPKHPLLPYTPFLWSPSLLYTAAPSR